MRSTLLEAYAVAHAEQPLLHRCWILGEDCHQRGVPSAIGVRVLPEKRLPPGRSGLRILNARSLRCLNAHRSMSSSNGETGRRQRYDSGRDRPIVKIHRAPATSTRPRHRRRSAEDCCRSCEASSSIALSRLARDRARSAASRAVRAFIVAFSCPRWADALTS